MTPHADTGLPDRALPRGACDCHVHVFGDPARFPFAPKRAYTPGRADTDTLVAHLKACGLSRAVIVQPSPYGFDNSCTLAAIDALGPQFRGVAVLDPEDTSVDLAALHAAGVRGVRLNLVTTGRDDGAGAMAAIETLASRIAHLGWHVQIFSGLATTVHVARACLARALDVPLVFDHFAGASARTDPGGDAWSTVLELVRSGRAYVKASAPHRAERGGTVGPADPLARSLIAANPERVLWGSDWPHTSSSARRPEDVDRIEPFEAIDDGKVLERLRAWCGDADTLTTVLVANPARLYGFTPGDMVSSRST
jgi:predicted TIM-barrel fold metal-dependent hydrolase